MLSAEAARVPVLPPRVAGSAPPQATASDATMAFFPLRCYRSTDPLGGPGIGQLPLPSARCVTLHRSLPLSEPSRIPLSSQSAWGLEEGCLYPGTEWVFHKWQPQRDGGGLVQPSDTSLLVGPLCSSALHTLDFTRFKTPDSHSLSCSQEYVRSMEEVPQRLLGDKHRAATTHAAGRQPGSPQGENRRE